MDLTTIEPFKIIVTEDKSFLKQYKNEIFKMIHDAYSEYGESKLGVNGMDKRISESSNSDIQKIEEARKFISRLFNLHYEDGFNEMLPEWRDRLLSSIDLIYDGIENSLIPSDKVKMYNAAISRAETCLEDMDVLSFKKIQI